MSASSSSSSSGETRRILGLAWPVMLTSLNWTLLQLSDLVVLGWTGSDQVAGFGASRALFFVVIMIGVGGMTGVLVRASQADGAKDLPGTGAAFRQGLVLALIVGLPVGAALLALARPLLEAIGVAREVVPLGARVAQVMAIAFPFQMFGIAASYFLEGVSRPTRVTVVNLAVLPVNALLAWAWSGGHWGLPAWGAVGAASATACAAAVNAAALIASAWLLRDGEARGIRHWQGLFRRDTWTGALGLLRFGTMPGIASGLELAGFSVLIALSTQLGDAAAHAFQIVFAIHNVAFGVAMGFGSAAGVRAGNAVGEEVPQAAPGRAAVAAVLSAAVTGLIALGVVLARHPLIEAFPAEPEVHAIALAMLPLWAPFILFDGIQIVCLFALRSLGDQVVAGVNSILAYFLITGGAGLLLVHLGYGTTGLVLASGIGMVSAAALHGLRLLWISRRYRRQS